MLSEVVEQVWSLIRVSIRVSKPRLHLVAGKNTEEMHRGWIVVGQIFLIVLGLKNHRLPIVNEPYVELELMSNVNDVFLSK